jgi:hypothetical protein
LHAQDCASAKEVTTILTRDGLTAEAGDDPAARLEARAQIGLLDLAGEDLGDESSRGFFLMTL